MYLNTPSYLSDSPIYKQAMVVFTLSRSISTYLNQDLASLYEDGSEDASIYVTGDIIQQSENLFPNIIHAELEPFSERKQEYLISLKKLTNKLHKNCIRLENCRSNGREYLPLLRKEIKKFVHLQKTWMLTL